MFWGGQALVAVTAALVGFAAFLVLYKFDWMGAGDVKLIGVLGLWLGAALGMAWLAGTLLCGLHALGLVARRRYWGGSMLTDGKERVIPYGAYLAIGALWVIGMR